MSLHSTVSAAGIVSLSVPGTVDPLVAVLKLRSGSFKPTLHGGPDPNVVTPALPPTVHSAVTTEVSGAH